MSRRLLETIGLLLMLVRAEAGVVARCRTARTRRCTRWVVTVVLLLLLLLLSDSLEHSIRTTARY